MIAARTVEDAWRALAEVLDPELPVLNVVELGIVRGVAVEGADGNGLRVTITPTFTACPAMRVIEREVGDRLRGAGFSPVTVETVLTPVWTSDWITHEGRRKLEAYGIAPPERGAAQAGSPWLDRQKPVACPRCGSVETALVSAFGSTPCKSLHRCGACLETFEHFKCH